MLFFFPEISSLYMYSLIGLLPSCTFGFLNLHIHGIHVLDVTSSGFYNANKLAVC